MKRKWYPPEALAPFVRGCPTRKPADWRDEGFNFFVSAQYLSTWCSEAIFAKNHERRTVREYLAFLAKQDSYEWGGNWRESRGKRTVPARIDLEEVCVASGILTRNVWSDEPTRAELAWVRGVARLQSASRAEQVANGLLDLAWGAKMRGERLPALVAAVESATNHEAYLAAREVLVQRAGGNYGGDSLRWDAPTDARLALATAALATNAIKEGLEQLDRFLGDEPGSPSGLALRSVFLARAQRADEAVNDLAAALAIQPELGEDANVLALLDADVVKKAKRR
jgi:hypothetical protein